MPTGSALRPAIVLSCEGDPGGALNTVRSLGEQGVPCIVVSETQQASAADSKYCVEHRIVGGFGRSAQALIQCFQELSDSHGLGLAVFPTADPDLRALATLASELAPYVQSMTSAAALVTTLLHKTSFYAEATRRNWPIPRTWAPTDVADVQALMGELTFPVIAKPSHPTAWKRTGLRSEIFDAKALLMEGPTALLELSTQLSPMGLEMLIQDYIVGDDDEHFEVHVYVNPQGKATTSFCGRKHRVYPPQAGSGCYIEGVDEAELERRTRVMLESIGYRGIANVDYKRDSRTGEFWLLEINARLSQWNILTARSGINMPWLAYCDAEGLPHEAAPKVRHGLFFVDGKNDLKAFLHHRRAGSFGWNDYLMSLMKWPLICQTFSWRDPYPWLRSISATAINLIGKRLGAK